MSAILSVALGGAFGSVLRYLLGLIPVKETMTFPIITFCINIIGAFIIGIIVAVVDKNNVLSPNTVLLLKVGFCGGFTTFSTFSLESVSLFENGKIALGILYVVLSVLFGIACVFAGKAIIR